MEIIIRKEQYVDLYRIGNGSLYRPEAPKVTELLRDSITFKIARSALFCFFSYFVDPNIESARKGESPFVEYWHHTLCNR